MFKDAILVIKKNEKTGSIKFPFINQQFLKYFNEDESKQASGFNSKIEATSWIWKLLNNSKIQCKNQNNKDSIDNKKKELDQDQELNLSQLIDKFFKKDKMYSSNDGHIEALHGSYFNLQYQSYARSHVPEDNFEINISQSIWEGDISVIIIFTSIKEQIRADKLQQINEQKDLIMANVTHDLKNPINGVLTYIEEAETFAKKQIRNGSAMVSNNYNNNANNNNTPISSSFALPFTVTQRKNSNINNTNNNGINSQFIQTQMLKSGPSNEFKLNEQYLNTCNSNHKIRSSKKLSSDSQQIPSYPNLKIQQSVQHQIKSPRNQNKHLNHTYRNSYNNLHHSKSQQENPFNYLLKMLRKTKNMTNELLILVRDIQDLNLIKHNKLKVFPRRINLNHVVKEVVEIFSHQIKAKNLQFIFQPFYQESHRDSTPYYISTDPFRLKQILVNLVSNSVKYTPKGSITLTIDQNELYDERLNIQVRDTGKGMTTNIQEKLFKQFNSFDQDTNSYGVGLGLCIIKDLVNYLGPVQQINVKSSVNNGSLFSFQIYKELKRNKSDSFSKRKTNFRFLQEEGRESQSFETIPENVSGQDFRNIPLVSVSPRLLSDSTSIDGLMLPDGLMLSSNGFILDDTSQITGNPSQKDIDLCYSTINNSAQRPQYSINNSNSNNGNNTMNNIFYSNNGSNNNNNLFVSANNRNSLVNSMQLGNNKKMSKRKLKLSIKQHFNNKPRELLNVQMQNHNSEDIKSSTSSMLKSAAQVNNSSNINNSQQQQEEGLKQWFEHNKRILLVDDEEWNILNLKLQFNRITSILNIQEFSDGSEAYEYVKQNENTVDMIFIDKQMQIMGGLEAAKKISQINPQIRIFLCTADEFCLDEQFEGIHGIITKPVNLQKLQDLHQQQKTCQNNSISNKNCRDNNTDIEQNSTKANGNS